MKKLLISIFTFAIIALFTTGILINIKNSKAENNEEINMEKEHKETSGNEEITENDEIKKEDVVEEKTIDLYGTYDENDLIIISKTINIENVYNELKIPQISGLKNKTIENKVNKNIEETIVNKVKEMNEVGLFDIDSTNNTIYHEVIGNFSNVLSMRYTISRIPIIEEDRI